MSTPKLSIRWVVEDLGLSNSKGIAVQAMKANRGCRGLAPFMMNLGTRWKLVVTFMHRPGNNSDNHWIEGWVGLIAGVGFFFYWRGDDYCFFQVLNPRPPSTCLVATLFLLHGWIMLKWIIKSGKGGCKLDLSCRISGLRCGMRSSPLWDAGSLDWDGRCWAAYLSHLQESVSLAWRWDR